MLNRSARNTHGSGGRVQQTNSTQTAVPIKPTQDQALTQFTPGLHRLSSLYAGGNYHLQQDLFQQGALGLFHAVNRFDPVRGVKLSTFADRYVRGYMQNYLRAESKHASCFSLHEQPVTIVWDGEEDAVSPIDEVIDEMAFESFMWQVESRLIKRPLAAVLHGMTVNQQFILRLRFEHDLRPSEIAAYLRVSPARISQVLHEAITKLNKAII